MPAGLIQEKSIPECASPSAAPGTLVCVHSQGTPTPRQDVHACSTRVQVRRSLWAHPRPSSSLPGCVTPGGAQHLLGPLPHLQPERAEPADSQGPSQASPDDSTCSTWSHLAPTGTGQHSEIKKKQNRGGEGQTNGPRGVVGKKTHFPLSSPRIPPLPERLALPSGAFSPQATQTH